MAVKIDLPQRTETGRSGPAQAKPGFNLAEGAGMAQAGAATAQFAGTLFDGLVKSRAANEESEFQGGVNKALQDWDTYVAANPEASYEELQKQRGIMMKGIKDSGKNATTRLGKQNIANWYKRNESTLFGKTQASMERIRTRQERERYQITQKNNMQNFDRLAYIEAKEDMVKSNLINADVAEEQQKFDFAVIDEAEKKVAIDNATGLGFAAWEQTVTESDPDGDLNAAYDAIEALGVPDEEKQEIESEIKTRVQNRRAEAKLEVEQADAQSVEQISKWINDGELSGITQRIKQLPLTETRKREEIKKAKDYIKSINDTKDDIATSDETNIAIDRILSRLRNDKDYTYDQGLDDYAKLSKGVKASEGSKNLDDIRKAADAVSDPILSRPSMVRAQRSLQSILTAKKAGLKTQLKGQELLTATQTAEAGTQRMQNDLDQWARENADAPDFDKKLELKTQQLLTPVVEDVVLNMFQKVGGGVFGILPGVRFPSEIQEFRRQESLEAQPIYGQFTEAEKKQAKTLIDEGKTVNEVISEVKFAGLDAKPVTATNPDTGETVTSYDGGKTWQ